MVDAGREDREEEALVRMCSIVSYKESVKLLAHAETWAETGKYLNKTLMFMPLA